MLSEGEEKQRDSTPQRYGYKFPKPQELPSYSETEIICNVIRQIIHTREEVILWCLKIYLKYLMEMFGKHDETCANLESLSGKQFYDIN